MSALQVGFFCVGSVSGIHALEHQSLTLQFYGVGGVFRLSRQLGKTRLKSTWSEVREQNGAGPRGQSGRALASREWTSCSAQCSSRFVRWQGSAWWNGGGVESRRQSYAATTARPVALVVLLRTCG